MKKMNADIINILASRMAWYNKEIDKKLLDDLSRYSYIERSREIAQIAMEAGIFEQVLIDADKIYKCCRNRDLGFMILGNEVIKLDE
jgi:hypothetical protein